MGGMDWPDFSIAMTRSRKPKKVLQYIDLPLGSHHEALMIYIVLPQFCPKLTNFLLKAFTKLLYFSTALLL